MRASLVVTAVRSWLKEGSFRYRPDPCISLARSKNECNRLDMPGTSDRMPGSDLCILPWKGGRGSSNNPLTYASFRKPGKAFGVIRLARKFNLLI